MEYGKINNLTNKNQYGIIHMRVMAPALRALPALSGDTKDRRRSKPLN